MIDCAIDDRGMIIEAVLNGILSAEHITMEEIEELEHALFEEICDEMTPFATWETLQ